MRMNLVVAALASLLMITGAQAQDGARAYHLLPQGTDIVSATMDVLHAARSYDAPSPVTSSTTDATAVTAAYQGSFDLFGNASDFLIGVPLGSVSTTLGTLGGDVDLQTGPAVGDLFVGGIVGLVGSPTLSPMEYAQYKPGFRASVAAKLFLPTGTYDSSQQLNMGGNRWSLQASLPISYVLADSMIDPALTTFEITPSVQIFGDNTDSFGPTTVTSQAPLFGLEGHVTHNFGPTVWGALDSYFIAGGETSADGVAQGDAKQELSLGATLGVSLTQALALRLSYSQLVYSNAPDASGQHFEVVSAYSF